MHKERDVVYELWGIFLVICLLAGMIISFFFFGDLFQQNMSIFLIAWALIPLIAFGFSLPPAEKEHSEASMRSWRLWMMLFVVMTSLTVLFDFHDIRNHFGKKYVQGYKHWKGETYYGEDDHELFTEHRWTAATATGRTSLTVFHIVTFIGAFGIPYATFKLMKKGIHRHEVKRWAKETEEHLKKQKEEREIALQNIRAKQKITSEASVGPHY